MAEQNQEITYIPYGQDEISQQDLMTNLANGVEGYLGSKRWARKDKYRNAWLAAYQDIIGRGLIGASNDSGVWTVNHNGEAIPLDSKSNVEREMYQDAAYYIQQQMAKMTPRKKEEEKKKEDLTPFDFKGSFSQQLLNNRFGGDDKLFNSTETGWNTLDARDEKTGLRKTEKRREAMASELEAYLKTIEDGKFNFEGTSFKDENDARTKIQTAINALRKTPEDESDDIPAFNALGLNYRSFFSNGGNEASTHLDSNGNPYTYNQWNQLQQQQAETKAKQDKQNAYNNTLFINRVTNPKMQGQNPRALKEKYKDNNTLLSTLQGYAQKDIRTLSPDEQSEIHGAYKYLAKQPIDNKLLRQLQSSSSGLYKNAAPNRFKKIQGIDNLIWDSAAGQIIQINTRQQQQAIQNQPQDLFAGVQTQQEIQNKQQITPRGGGVELTDSDYRDIYATIADLGALINPEVFTGTAMALSASTARTWNSIEQNGLWDTLTDWKTWADWGTGALGGTALLGDASSAVKVIRGFGKLMTIPMVYGSLKSIPEAKAAWDKIDLDHPFESAKKLTPQDYHALSTFLMGIISGRNYLRGNLAERAVLEHSGINTESKSKIREYLNKSGITRTKPQDQKTVSTLKVKKTGEDGKVKEKDIELTKEQKQAIQKAKPTEIEKVAQDAGVKIPEGYKIEVNKSKINTAKSYFGKGNSEVINKKTREATKGNDDFNNWLENRGAWSRWKLGTDKNLKRIRENLGVKPINPQENSSQETSKTSPSNVIKKETPLTSEQATELKQNVKSWRQEHKDILNINKNKGRDYEWGKNDVGTNPEKLKSTVKLGDKELNVEIASDGILIINGEKTSINGFGKNGKQQVRKKIKEVVQQMTKQQRLKRNTEEFSKLVTELKKLKSSGFLKQGGQINPSADKIIEDFFKNNNI